MRIPVPHSDGLPLVTIILFTPKGEVSATVDDRHWWVDIPLPDGVEEDEVDVYSCFLGADHRPPFGCGPALVKAATRKPETVPAPAVEPAQVVEPNPAAFVPEPETVLETAPAPTIEPAPAVEPEPVLAGEPATDGSERENE